MNRFVTSALALSAASSLAFGGTPSSESEDWLSLDREIESLASSLSQGSNTFEVTGFFRAFLLYSNDIEDVTASGSPSTEGSPSGNDLFGFSLFNGRLNFDGSIEDYSIHLALEGVEGESASAGSSLREVGGGLQSTGTGASVYLGEVGTASSTWMIEAYMATPITEEIGLMLGQFRSPFIQSALIDSDRLVLPYRSFNGAVWDGRDIGIQVNGDHDRLHWWAAVQNGADGAGDEFHYTIRGAFDVLGEGGLPRQEGSHGKSQNEHLWVAAAYTVDDENVSTGEDLDAWALEGGFSQGNFGVNAEYVHYSEGFTATTESLSPLAIAANFLFNPDWEVAARGEWIADHDHTAIYTVGVNYYVAGHAAKWQLAWSTVDSDADARDYDVISVGFAGGIGR